MQNASVSPLGPGPHAHWSQAMGQGAEGTRPLSGVRDRGEVQSTGAAVAGGGKDIFTRENVSVIDTACLKIVLLSA